MFWRESVIRDCISRPFGVDGWSWPRGEQVRFYQFVCRLVKYGDISSVMERRWGGGKISGGAE